MRRWLLGLITVAALYVAVVGSAQAMVVTVSGRQYGIAPPTNAALPPDLKPPPVCVDRWMPGDLLTYPDRLANSGALCYHGGAVLHANETFVHTWDPTRAYHAFTRRLLEQFLRDVADSSGGLGTPYADVTQYQEDDGGRAGNLSKYGGACIDLGSAGGASCDFTGTFTTGSDFPSGACAPSTSSNCTLTDDQVRVELTTMITRTRLADQHQPGYTPLVVLLTPPGVKICLDSGAAASVCSANDPPQTAKSTFCSYHGQLPVTTSTGITVVPYIVQPFTAEVSSCYPATADPIGANTSELQKERTYADRMTSTLSRSQLAAIVNPAMNGWFKLNNVEIGDGCNLPSRLSEYWMFSAFNNAGLLAADPPICATGVELQPRFVVPSPLDAGDIILFDGSVTDSTLMVPKAGYVWNFGDGTGRPGPSVVHAFAKSGVYSVQLTVTDRGGNVATTTQQVTVTGSGGTSPPPNTKTKLHASIALIPQSYKSLLRSGIALRVTSSEPADGFSTILISRSAARRAHLRTGRSANVVVARGTVSGIKNGTVRLHLRLAPSVTTKLARLGHLKLTIKLSLIGASGARATIDAAGSY